MLMLDLFVEEASEVSKINIKLLHTTDMIDKII